MQILSTVKIRSIYLYTIVFVLDKKNNEDIKELTENREEEKKLVKSRRMYACQLGCMDQYKSNK
jgi:hypothetical protein